jgi:hypothetical protein
MTFKPMYDLEHLTEAQREEYYLSACEYYGIPPELNALAFIWMDSSDGKRNLTLYAKKAATDIIRGNRNISTTRLEKFDGDGYVGWVVEGRDTTGRTEMAVGTASTDGQKGQALAMMAMLAQTRATRRMTLQFVGGLLDESELPTTVTNIGRSGASLASLATVPAPVQPSVTPNSDAGVDVTPKEYLTDPMGKVLPAQIFSLEPPFQIAPRPFVDGDITPNQTETAEQIEAYTAYPGFAEMAKTITDPAILVAAKSVFEAPAAEPKKRRRRTKAEINLDSAEFAQASTVEMPTRPIPPPFGPPAIFTNIDVAVTEESPTQMNIPTQESAQQALTVVAATTIPSPPTSVFLQDVNVPMPRMVVPEPAQERIQTTVFPPDVVVDPDMPSEAEEKMWRARLFVYTNDILPKGGMAKADGIIWKIRKYVQNMFPELPVKNGTVKLNNTQWKALMNNLDTVVAVSKPEGLVKVIEEVAAKS